MPTLKDQLVGRGLVSKKRRTEIEERQARKKGSGGGQQEIATGITIETSSLREFRELAKQRLLLDPKQIGKLIGEAQRFREEEGGSRLIWQLIQIRNLLPRVSPRVRERFLKRGLRRNNPTFSLDF